MGNNETYTWIRPVHCNIVAKLSLHLEFGGVAAAPEPVMHVRRSVRADICVDYLMDVDPQ